jgi:hypothetical protein
LTTSVDDANIEFSPCVADGNSFASPGAKLLNVDVITTRPKAFLT